MMRIDWDTVIEDTALAVLPGPLAARLMLWRQERRSDAAVTATRRQDRLRAILEAKPEPKPAAQGVAEVKGATRDGTTGSPIRAIRKRPRQPPRKRSKQLAAGAE
jgi:hypothetical protein